MIPARRSDVLVREIEGETLVLDHQSGKVHQFNATAGFIWACCDGLSTVSDIAGRLSVEYGVSAADLEPDVISTIGKFHELGLLVDHTNQQASE